MSSLTKMFSGGAQRLKMPTPPPIQRMPTETDPELLAAAQRTRASALRRKGRMSTILTDQTKSVMGSSGTTLGA